MIPVPSGAESHHDATGTVATFHVVVQRPAVAQGDADHLTLGLLGGFTDGLGDLLGLALAESDAALLVTDDDERGKTEALTALDGLGHTVDRDQTVGEFRGFFPVAATASAAPTVVVTFCHVAIPSSLGGRP